MVDCLHSKDPAWAEQKRRQMKAPQLIRGSFDVHLLGQYFSTLVIKNKMHCQFIPVKQLAPGKQFGPISKKYAK